MASSSFVRNSDSDSGYWTPVAKVGVGKARNWLSIIYMGYYDGYSLWEGKGFLEDCWVVFFKGSECLGADFERIYSGFFVFSGRTFSIKEKSFVMKMSSLSFSSSESVSDLFQTIFLSTFGSNFRKGLTEWCLYSISFFFEEPNWNSSSEGNGSFSGLERIDWLSYRPYLTFFWDSFGGISWDFGFLSISYNILMVLFLG